MRERLRPSALFLFSLCTFFLGRREDDSSTLKNNTRQETSCIVSPELRTYLLSHLLPLATASLLLNLFLLSPRIKYRINLMMRYRKERAQERERERNATGEVDVIREASESGNNNKKRGFFGGQPVTISSPLLALPFS